MLTYIVKSLETITSRELIVGIFIGVICTLIAAGIVTALGFGARSLFGRGIPWLLDKWSQRSEKSRQRKINQLAKQAEQFRAMIAAGRTGTNLMLVEIARMILYGIVSLFAMIMCATMGLSTVIDTAEEIILKGSVIANQDILHKVNVLIVKDSFSTILLVAGSIYFLIMVGAAFNKTNLYANPHRYVRYLEGRIAKLSKIGNS